MNSTNTSQNTIPVNKVIGILLLVLSSIISYVVSYGIVYFVNSAVIPALGSAEGVSGYFVFTIAAAYPLAILNYFAYKVLTDTVSDKLTWSAKLFALVIIAFLLVAISIAAVLITKNYNAIIGEKASVSPYTLWITSLVSSVFFGFSVKYLYTHKD